MGGATGILGVLCIAILSLCVTVSLAYTLDARRAFDQNDVMFGDDTLGGRTAFSDGWSPFNLYRHPNLHFFTGHPIRLITAALVGDRPGLRRRLGLAVAPVAGALSLLALGSTLMRTGIPPLHAVTLTWLAASSFAHLLFSSLPTHFSVSALTLVTCLWGVARPLHSTTAWLLLGFVATSVTSSNLLPWAIAYLLAQPDPQALTARLVRTIGASAAVVLMVVVFNTVVSSVLYGVPQIAYVMGQPTVTADTKKWIRFDLIDRVAAMPVALLQGIAGGTVIRSPISPPQPGDVFAYTLRLAQPLWTVLVAALLTAALLVASLARRPRHMALRITADAAMLMIAAHALILGLYGGPSLFLYAGHWHLSLVVVIAAAVSGRETWWSDYALVLLAALTPILSWMTWRDVFRLLAP